MRPRVVQSGEHEADVGRNGAFARDEIEEMPVATAAFGSLK